MNGETANLAIVLSLRDKASLGIQKIDKGFAGLAKRTEKLRASLGKVREGLVKGIKVGAAVAAGGIAFLAFNVRAGIESLAELEDVQKQTQAVLKSTGKAAGVTADEVRSLAEKYEDLTTVDDKVIQRGENLLLTFTNVRKKAFEPATQAALDMAAALRMDTSSAFRTVGRALNDPIAGMSRLARAGVTFTEQQKKVITRLVETGRSAEAQRIILRRLNTQFGGSATAAANGYRGQMRRLDDAVETLRQSLARGLLPALTNIARKAGNFLKSDKVVKQVDEIGAAIAGLFGPDINTVQPNAGSALTEGLVKSLEQSPFDKAVQKIRGLFDEIQGLPWESIKGALSQAAAIGAKAFDIFQQLPPEVRAGLITMLAVNKVTGGALAGLGKIALDLALKAVTTIMAGNVTVIGTSVTTPGVPNIPGPKGPNVPSGPKGPGILGALGFLGIALTPRSEIGMQSDAEIKAKLEGILAEQRRVRALAEGESITTRTGNAILTGVRGSIQLVQDHAALQARLAPVQNDILNGIATNTTTIPEDGKAARNISQEASQASTRNLSALTAKVGEVRGSVSRQTPILGAVRSAVAATTAAVRAKDLSVTVRTSLSVSAREIASEVQRVTNNGGMVRS